MVRSTATTVLSGGSLVQLSSGFPCRVFFAAFLNFEWFLSFSQYALAQQIMRKWQLQVEAEA